MNPLALVVDDEDSIRELIAITLEMEGYRTVQAPDGPTAIELARRFLPDVISLDIMMPGMDGWQVAERLGWDATTAGIPIVIVSGKPMVDLESNPMRGRASAVLSKPFDFARFVEVVASVRTPAVPSPRPATHDVPAPVRPRS